MRDNIFLWKFFAKKVFLLLFFSKFNDITHFLIIHFILGQLHFIKIEFLKMTILEVNSFFVKIRFGHLHFSIFLKIFAKIYISK